MGYLNNKSDFIPFFKYVGTYSQGEDPGSLGLRRLVAHRGPLKVPFLLVFLYRSLVREDSEGFFTVVGRIKEIIITAGGENIAPTNIEDEIKKELEEVFSGSCICS